MHHKVTVSDITNEHLCLHLIEIWMTAVEVGDTIVMHRHEGLLVSQELLHCAVTEHIGALYLNYAAGGRGEEYVAKLKTQARKCNFEVSEMDNLIRDKLLATCPSSKVKESMLEEDTLTLSRAVMSW